MIILNPCREDFQALARKDARVVAELLSHDTVRGYVSTVHNNGLVRIDTQWTMVDRIMSIEVGTHTQEAVVTFSPSFHRADFMAYVMRRLGARDDVRIESARPETVVTLLSYAAEKAYNDAKREFIRLDTENQPKE